MKFLLASALMFLSINAFATTLPGLDEATTVCSRMPFDTDKMKCLNLVRDRSFDIGAVAICGGMPFDSDKMKCLELIRDRQFSSSAEIAICAKMPFNSDKMKCLAEAGSRPFPNEPVCRNERQTLNTADRMIDEAFYFLRRGDQRRAELILLETQRMIRRHTEL